jgi:hypothetical protein
VTFTHSLTHVAESKNFELQPIFRFEKNSKKSQQTSAHLPFNNNNNKIIFFFLSLSLSWRTKLNIFMCMFVPTSKNRWFRYESRKQSKKGILLGLGCNIIHLCMCGKTCEVRWNKEEFLFYFFKVTFKSVNEYFDAFEKMFFSSSSSSCILFLDFHLHITYSFHRQTSCSLHTLTIMMYL